MTLKTRNQLFKIFFLFELVTVVFSAVLFIISLTTNMMITPPSLRIPSFLNFFPFLKSDLHAVLLSFLILSIYVLATTGAIIVFFENTQCSEIIFFSAFLLGCMCEIARFITICFGLWQTFSNLLIFCGNIVLFGRIASAMSFLFAAILSETSQRQDIERNFMTVIAVSIMLAIMIPMNTAKITTTGQVVEGFMKTLTIVKFFLCMLTALSFFLHALNHSAVEFFRVFISFLVLFIGYIFLIYADCFVILISGTVFLAAGTFFYLKNLHHIYLWA